MGEAVLGSCGLHLQGKPGILRCMGEYPLMCLTERLCTQRVIKSENISSCPVSCLLWGYLYLCFVSFLFVYVCYQMSMFVYFFLSIFRQGYLMDIQFLSGLKIFVSFNVTRLRPNGHKISQSASVKYY